MKLTEAQAVHKIISGFGELVSLRDLCDIRRGLDLSPYKNLTANADEENITLVLKNIDEDEYDRKTSAVQWQDTVVISLDSSANPDFLLPGDILLDVELGNSARIYLLPNERAIIDDTQFCVRIHDPRITPAYLIGYLNSDVGRLLLQAFGLAELAVPIVENIYLAGWQTIDQVVHNFDELVMSLLEMRNAVFDARDSQEFKSRILKLKRQSGMIITSLHALERLEFQYANFYPFPLAYSYRLLDSIFIPSELYAEQLRVAENILAFTGSISLALAYKLDLHKSLDLAYYWQKGISPGHWREMLIHCAKSFQHVEHPLLRAIYQLHPENQQKGFGAILNELIKIKNDFKHNRGPKIEEDYFEGTQQVGELLRECMQALDFFTEYPIRQVLDINADRSGAVIVRCLNYIGDHPGLPQEDIPFPRPLQKLDLFIDLGEQDWVPLYPFIVALNCPRCKTRETYFIDMWDTHKKIAHLISFERGHTEENIQIAQALSES